MRSLSIITWLVVIHFSIRVFADNDTEARNAFKEGVAAFEAGQTEEALVLFKRAYALRPSYKILFNIAQAQAEAGKNAKASRTFEKYLQDGGNDISEGRRAKVEAEIKRLQQLRESASPPPPKAPEIEQSNASPTLESEVSTEPKRSVLFDMAPWAAAGLGATTLTIGAILAARTASLNRKLGDTCNDGHCSPDYKDDIDSLKKKAIAADVMFVATSVFSAAAVSLFILRKKRKATP